MAVRKIMDLAVKTGSYQNQQGENKNRYQNVGALMEGDNGKFLFLEKWFNPAGVESQGSSIIVSMFEPRQHNQNNQQNNNNQQQNQNQNNSNNQQNNQQQNNQNNGGNNPANYDGGNDTIPF